MELRFRPKSDFLHEANWQELYVLTEYWNLDLDYYSDELRFLGRLIDKYFIWLLHDENIDKAREISKDILDAETEKDRIKEKTGKHLRHIAELIKNPGHPDELAFRDEHAELEESLAEFAKRFRAVKRKVFAITEKIMESEKLQHLLNS